MPMITQDVLQTLKIMGRLARTHFGALLLAAFLPFICSHLIVLQARFVGMPYRLGLDISHGLFVLAYLSTVARLEFQGLARFGFARPRFVWFGVKPLALALVCVMLVGVPMAFLLHPLTHMLEQMNVDQRGLWTAVPTVMVPEFTMTALIGLALAAVRVKVLP